MEIRRIQKDEFQNAAILLRGMGKVEEEDFHRRFIDIVQNTDYLFIGAIHKERVIGYGLAQDYGVHLRLGKKICRLHDLYVLPEYRRTGIARKLMDVTAEWCKSVGATWLQWNASKQSTKFYEKIGCERLTYDEDKPEFELEFKV
ncbi:GNAT family N-acetyltransferase [Planococcus halotolerans]|uniref:GNAT family N-acetyltransferase n=1 Tax=Planococcus halotolerans TaxID=2233542 RepID=UPI0013675E29|nr:GNAT family N-acetyltransferase [Planococcus halotolerans]QHJ69946.1 GNAT family N-acetyltransferase [Planococcus halotolerans]